MYYREGWKDGKLINIWRIVEAMEAKYPGQSHRTRTDFIFLLVCCGNDYLPRVRGINFAKCMEAYSAVKGKWTKRRREKDAFVVNGSKKSFNLEFLYEFFGHLMTAGYVPPIPEFPSFSCPYSAVQSLNQAVAQKTISSGTVVWFDTMQVKGKDPHHRQMWQTSLRVGDHVFTGTPHPRIRTVKQELAAAALQSLTPQTYLELVEKERVWKEQLEDHESKKDKEEDMFKGSEKSQVVNNKALCSVEGYLRGLLWNIHMYEDGYVPVSWKRISDKHCFTKPTVYSQVLCFVPFLIFISFSLTQDWFYACEWRFCGCVFFPQNIISDSSDVVHIPHRNQS